MKRKSGSSENSALVGIVTAVVVVASLYFGKTVFIPLALALLLSILLSPVIRFLELLHAPRVLAILLTVFALGTFIGLLGWKASEQLTNLAIQLPTYRTTLEKKVHVLRALRSPSLNRASATVDELENEIVNTMPGASPQESRARLASRPGYSAERPMTVEVIQASRPVETVATLLGPLATAGMIGIFTILMLIGREDLRNRFIHLAGSGHLTVVTQALDDAASRIHRYLLLQSVVNAAFGGVVGTALYFIGIPNAWLWGLMAAVFRFLPYVGPPLAALMPILLSLAVFAGWGHALATAGFFLVLELIVSNLVEPFVYGAHVGLSPLAILVAAVFWTLIWGLPGLLLSTPLTVCVVVMGRYVPSLRFFSVLLGDDPVLAPPAQYYQRLIAGDEAEARRVLEQYRREHSLEELFSDVLVPALILAERDRHRDELDETMQSFVYQSIRETIEELGEASVEQALDAEGATDSETSTSSPWSSHSLNVLCLPARDDADHIVALLLSQLLEARGFQTRCLILDEMTEMLPVIARLKPETVCISALPPFAIEHARKLYQKLLSQCPGIHIAICLWHFDGDAQKLALRLKVGNEHQVLLTLAEVVDHIASRTPQEPQPFTAEPVPLRVSLHG